MFLPQIQRLASGVARSADFGNTVSLPFIIRGERHHDREQLVCLVNALLLDSSR